MKPWKRAELFGRLRRDIGLQWGHGDEAVEEAEHNLVMHELAELQWGHGDEAVEEEIDILALVAEAVASMGPRR